MPKKLISEVLSLIYIQDIRIKTEENILSDAQFEKLSATKEYKNLIKKGRFIVTDVEEEVVETEAPKEVTDMNLKELKAYGKLKGLTGISQMTKEDILAMIAELED